MEKKKLMDILGADKKKIKVDIVTFVAVGVGLMLIGGSFGKKDEGSTAKTTVSERQEKTEKLEDRLEYILSKIEGAGKTEVLITYKSSRELVVAQQINEENTETKETAKDGDERDIKSGTKESLYVLIENSDGSETPLVLKEEEPEIEGVIIVAEGGDNILVKNSLINATEAALGVSTHKIQVLKMEV